MRSNLSKFWVPLFVLSVLFIVGCDFLIAWDRSLVVTYDLYGPGPFIVTYTDSTGTVKTTDEVDSFDYEFVKLGLSKDFEIDITFLVEDLSPDNSCQAVLYARFPNKMSNARAIVYEQPTTQSSDFSVKLTYGNVLYNP